MSHGMRSRLSLCKDVGNRELACPRPRYAMSRTNSFDSETCRPVRKLLSCTSLPAEGEPGCEILDILLEKACLGDVDRPSGFTQSSYGSPPVRASNPLIHDVHFTQKKAPLFVPPGFSCRSGSNLPYKKSSACGTSFGSKPFVRVEGFASSPSDARGVPTLA